LGSKINQKYIQAVITAEACHGKRLLYSIILICKALYNVSVKPNLRNVHLLSFPLIPSPQSPPQREGKLCHDRTGFLLGAYNFGAFPSFLLGGEALQYSHQTRCCYWEFTILVLGPPSQREGKLCNTRSVRSLQFRCVSFLPIGRGSSAILTPDSMLLLGVYNLGAFHSFPKGGEALQYSHQTRCFNWEFTISVRFTPSQREEKLCNNRTRLDAAIGSLQSWCVSLLPKGRGNSAILAPNPMLLLGIYNLGLFPSPWGEGARGRGSTSCYTPALCSAI